VWKPVSRHKELEKDEAQLALVSLAKDNPSIFRN
jgi:hypothetical protein